MSDVSAIAIVQSLKELHTDHYARREARERFIREVSPTEIAVLALVHRWSYFNLNKEMGPKTVGEWIAEGADLTMRELPRVLANLESKRLIEVDKAVFSRKTSLSWTRTGSERCYAYLNEWGWESLAGALRSHRHLGHGGPPYLGGDGLSGYSSADR